MKYAFFALLFFVTFVYSARAQSIDSISQVSNSLNDSIHLDKAEYSDVPTSNTIITAAEIQERGYDNLDELLASVQGISLTHDRTFTQIGIRGISPTAENNQRVKILLDGVPLNNPLTGQAPSGFDLSGIAMEDIQKVIIIRSSSPVENGNNAMLGLIKIITKKPKKGLRFNFDTGSFGEMDGGFSMGQIFGKTAVGLSGRLANISGQDLYFPGDSTLNKEAGDFGGLRLRLSQGKFSFNGFYNSWERQGNNYPLDPITTFDDFDTTSQFDGFRGFRQKIDSAGIAKGKQVYADLSFSTPFKSNQFIDVRLFFNFEKQEEQVFFQDNVFRYFLDTSIMLVDSIPWDQVDFFEIPKQKSLWVGMDYHHRIQLTSNHQLRFGTNLLALPIAEYEKSLTPTYHIFIPDNEFTSTDFPDDILQYLDLFTDSLYTEKSFFDFWSTSFYVSDQYRFNEKVAVQGGLRFDINSQTKPVFAPEISLLLTPFGNKTNLRLGYMQGYRLPSLLETNASPVGSMAPPTRDFIPEKSNSFEFGWRQKIGDGLDLNMTLYHQRLEDLVWNEFTDPPSQVDSTISVTGLEGALGLNLTKKVKSYLNYNFQFDRQKIYNMPSPLCKFGVTVPILKHFTLFTEGQYEGSRRTLTGGNTLPYFLMNANLLIRPRLDESSAAGKWLNKVSFSFRVYNILDQFYQHPAETHQVRSGLIPQNGRTWQTQLTVQF